MLKMFLAGCVAILYFTGCAQQPKPVQHVVETVHIEGKRWQLMSFGNHAMVVPQNAWMLLHNERYEGFAGCNGLGGSYEKDGKTIHFAMDPHTMLACPDIKGENEFRKRLLEVDAYDFEDGMLVLKRNGEKSLLFMEFEK
ncbi:META domain-containing protein [Hydrogenimonas sp.]|uniref:META domain-containing protein n=1 Tax=Hydrogenimonas sp. TaxID=2231112 RepID=UPI002632213C|nr:META domain-containing protein [Hydrogenimonas sp.]